MQNDDNDYDEILNRTWDEIPDEKVLPDGWYVLTAKNANFQKPKGDGNAKILIFYTVADALGEDDGGPRQDALEALGADYDMTENEIVQTIWVSGNKDWRAAKRHLALLGVTTEGKSLMDGLKEVKGNPIAARLEYRTYQNKAGITVEQNDPKEFAPIN